MEPGGSKNQFFADSQGTQAATSAGNLVLANTYIYSLRLLGAEALLVAEICPAE